MRIAGNERHLADRFAGGNVGYETTRAALVIHEHAETTGHDEEQREIVLPRAVKHHAAGQAEPIGFDQKTAQPCVAQIRQERELLQPLAQRLRIGGFATGSEGGQKSHVHISPARTLAYHTVQPPSTASAAPVTKLDADDARNNSGPRISSACAIRPSMVRPASRSA